MLTSNEDVTNCKINFENLPLQINDVQLKNVLSELEKTVRENEQKNVIKQIVDIYLSSIGENKENIEAKNCIFDFFTKFNSKKVVKKYLQDLISTNNITNSLIKSTIKDILETLTDKECNITQCTNLLNFVYSMQTSPTFTYEILIEDLFPLCFKILQGFVYHSKFDFENVAILEELFALVNAVLKQILTIFVKDIPYITIVAEEYSINLILLSHIMIMHKMIGFDIKTKAGLILTHSFNVIPEEISKKIKFKDCPTLELLEEFNKDDFTLLNHKLPVFRESEQLVIIYASILNVVPKEKLYQVKVEGRSLICILYDGLLESAKRTTSIPHLIVEVTRTLSIICKQMKEIPLELMEPLFLEAISFIWSHVNHFIDSVRNYTRLFFVELVVVAAYHKNNGCNTLCDILLESVKQLGCTQTIKFLALEYISVNISCEYILEHFKTVPEDLLKVISEPTISDEVCKSYMVMMEKNFHEVERELWINTWIYPATRLLQNCTHCSPFCQRIITRAFQIYPELLRKIFPKDYIGNCQESNLLLKCLQYARLNGMELTLERGERTGLYWRGLIDKPKLENFMIHQNDEIRISVLASIVECQKSTEVFLYWELSFLLKYLHYNITSQIPHFRKQIVSYYIKALARFNAGFHVITRHLGFLQKKVETGEANEEALNLLTVYQELADSYKNFFESLTKYLISNLTFDSNFPRRSVSLELLLTLQCHIPLDQWQAMWAEDDVKNCHSLLFDGYECNKKMAFALLKNLPAASMGFTNVEFTFNYMQRCLEIALEIKPSKTMSAAFLLELCAYSPYFYDVVQYGLNQVEVEQRYPLLDMLIILISKLIAQTNVEVDVSNARVANYGILLSIRHLLQMRNLTKCNAAYSGLFEHITTICLNLKDHIMPIVCNPSPEGHIPESGEIICESDESIRAQMVLVYAWRTMKEMTLLLAEIIRQTIKLESTCEMLAESMLIKIGDFFLDIFIATKHRGVFEQAYVGFSVICESFWTSTNPKLNCLPKTWLEDALCLCTGEKQSDKLCATRRSAGLPFLILSIIGSEPVFDKTRFHNSITKLLKACENLDPSNIEYRMHCMNVLRAMFRHGRLGEMVAAYIGQGVIVAINGFNSDTWGIRNSATLLYAALMTRMFGVQRTQDSDDLCLKNRLTVRVFFMRFPELFQFLLEKLTEESAKSDSLLLHPVLMILARLYPSSFEENDTQMDKYLPHLITCLSNPVYRTRELAARASVSFIRSDQIASHLDKIFDTLQETSINNDNQAHGYLLQAFYLVKSNEASDITISNYLEKTVYILKVAGKKISHMTVSLYMEVVMLFLMKYSNYDNLDMLKTIVNLLSKQITLNVLPITSMSKFSQTRMSLLLYIIVNKFEENDLTFSTLRNQTMCQLYGHDLEMKKYCLSLLIHLNEVNSAYKHPLYQTEELQIPSEIIMLVNSFDKSTIAKILTHTHQYLKYFLTEEIKHQHYIRVEDQVLVFILINYYPCVLKHLNLNKQETLDMLTNLCIDCDNEELISAVVSCISTFLLQLDYNVLKYNNVIQVLVESASPAASDYRRLAVCEFLTKNYILYCNEDSILSGDDLQMVLHIVMVLLEDDDIVVRNAISEFATALKVRITLSSNSKQTISGQRWPIIPEKAREDLLKLGSIILPKDRAICFLFSWTCRHFPDTTNGVSEVFERGELNNYAENVSFLSYCTQLLHELLWTLEDGLNYEDKSIFIEEHTLLVTTVLLDSIYKHPCPMMLYRTKVSVICALKSTVKFLESLEINTDFIEKFRKYLNDTILEYVNKHVEHSDLFSVKWIIKNIYDPILNPK